MSINYPKPPFANFPQEPSLPTNAAELDALSVPVGCDRETAVQRQWNLLHRALTRMEEAQTLLERRELACAELAATLDARERDHQERVVRSRERSRRVAKRERMVCRAALWLALFVAGFLLAVAQKGI